MTKTGMPFTQMLVASRGISDMEQVNQRLVELWERLGKNVAVYTVTADTHLRNGVPMNSRKELLDDAKNSQDDAIIMHYDTLAEGIDISTITGVFPMRNLSKFKLMQTIGRSSRPYVADLNDRGEVVDMVTRKKQFGVVTFPTVNGVPLNNIQSSEWVAAFASAGYGDIADFYNPATTTALPNSDDDLNLGEDEDPMMNAIVDSELTRDTQYLLIGSSLLALGS